MNQYFVTIKSPRVNGTYAVSAQSEAKARLAIALRQDVRFRDIVRVETESAFLARTGER